MSTRSRNCNDTAYNHFNPLFLQRKKEIERTIGLILKDKFIEVHRRILLKIVILDLHSFLQIPIEINLLSIMYTYLIFCNQ
jgi:hypothetical protein